MRLLMLAVVTGLLVASYEQPDLRPIAVSAAVAMGWAVAMADSPSARGSLHGAVGQGGGASSGPLRVAACRVCSPLEYPDIEFHTGQVICNACGHAERFEHGASVGPQVSPTEFPPNVTEDGRPLPRLENRVIRR